VSDFLCPADPPSCGGENPLLQALYLLAKIVRDGQQTQRMQELLASIRQSAVPVILCVIALIIAWRFPWPQLPDLLELWPMLF
jgi:hypothetical protein